MKKVFALALLSVFMIVQASVSAHAPSEINATFDSKTGELSIKVMHDVSKSAISDVSKHFINAITIKVNDKEVTTLNFTKQETPEFQSAKYKIEKTKKGDKITINASCNLKGSSSKDIKVE